MTSTITQQQHVRVGVGVLVKKDSSRKIYCGIRKGSHGEGLLALPGGHLELNETWTECAQREVMEEMGVLIENIKFAHVTNDIMKAEKKHYVTIFMMATCQDEPHNMEPHKCQGWNAYTWQELRDLYTREPNKLFGPLAKLVQEEPQNVLDFVGATGTASASIEEVAT